MKCEFSIYFKKSIIKPETYVWQQPDYNEDNDPFLRHFDEQGNFIEHIEQEKLEDTSENLNITYKYKEHKD